MPKTPKEKNTNIFTTARLSAELSREQAAEALQFVSEDRLYRIESGNIEPHPEEVVAMAKAYKRPALCNQYCSQMCRIGQNRPAYTQEKDLPQVALEIVTEINQLYAQKDRLIEIAADAELSNSEYEDFVEIRDNLNQMGTAIEALRLWVDTKSAQGQIDDIH